MDYRRNEDMISRDYGVGNALYNAVLDILFIEDSGDETEPVTLTEALQQCNIDNLGQDDTLILAYITVARQQCEGYTNIGFINRTIQAVVNNSAGLIYLPYGPIDEVTSITNNDGVAQDFKVVGVKWKQLEAPINERLIVQYTAGFTTPPQIFKTAILQQVAYLYEHRGDEKDGQLSPVAKSLLQPFRRI